MTSIASTTSIEELKNVDPDAEDEAFRAQAIDGEIRRITGEPVQSPTAPAPTQLAQPHPTYGYDRTLPGATGPAGNYDRTLKDLGNELFQNLRKARTVEMGGRQSLATGGLADRGGGRTRSSYLEATDLGGGYRPPSSEEVIGDRTSRGERQPFESLIPKLGGFFDALRKRVGSMGGGEPDAPSDPGMQAAPAGSEAPPAEEPAPDQNAGPLGPEAIGIENLGSFIERLLAQPSGFDSQEIQQIRDTMSMQRERERERAAGRISTDAARRGTFFSTIPAFQNEKLEQGLAEREALADAQLLSQAAQMEQAGIGQAVNAAMQFLQQGTNASLAQGQLALGNMQAGMQGMPTIPSSLAYLSQLPGGQAGGMDPSTFALLGMLMQSGGGGGSGGGPRYQGVIDAILNGSGYGPDSGTGGGALPPVIIDEEVPPTGLG